MMVVALSIGVMAATELLNQGGGTWSGYESDKTLYSKVVDNKNDGLAFKVTVWVKSDDGNKTEQPGTTKAVGEKGRVQLLERLDILIHW
jgi:hypothetical protein